jgi:hypothetical protein
MWFVKICEQTFDDDFVKSWFIPQTAAYEQRSGAEPDTLFQTLSKHFGGNGRLFGV